MTFLKRIREGFSSCIQFAPLLRRLRSEEKESPFREPPLVPDPDVPRPQPDVHSSVATTSSESSGITSTNASSPTSQSDVSLFSDDAHDVPIFVPATDLPDKITFPDNHFRLDMDKQLSAGVVVAHDASDRSCSVKVLVIRSDAKTDKRIKQGDMYKALGGVYKEIEILKANAKTNMGAPYLGEILQVGHDDLNRVYLIMPHYQTSLRDVMDNAINNRKRISFRDIARWTAEILIGVYLLHSRDIAHLDLRPENIMLDGPPNSEDLRVRIVNFGESLYFTELNSSREGTMVNTSGIDSAYAAPEVRRGGWCDGPKADAYSVGVIIWEMLLARHPRTIWVARKHYIDGELIYKESSVFDLRSKEYKASLKAVIPKSDFFQLLYRKVQMLSDNASNRPSARQVISNSFYTVNGIEPFSYNAKAQADVSAYRQSTRLSHLTPIDNVATPLVDHMSCDHLLPGSHCERIERT
ncbi:kinase-like domain-containing protein [Mucidula mucida]|nr:kinase-like domain-containing protein [Mucidula mucida]